MREPLSATLRRTIRESGLSRYAIAVRSGLDQGALSRFVTGKCGLTLDSADKLADALDLELRPRRKRKDS
jgi:transcriptional regulator with XRE-family HTH domain